MTLSKLPGRWRRTVDSGTRIGLLVRLSLVVGEAALAVFLLLSFAAIPVMTFAGGALVLVLMGATVIVSLGLILATLGAIPP